MRLFSGRAYPELADEVAAELGIPITPTSAYDFANGEIFIRFEESVRGSDAFVLQSHSAPVNKQIMEQLIMVDALKRASAKRITVVLPFYGYARQDKKHRGREPISARLMADLFKTAGADRLMCVDLHTSQIQGFFDGPVDHLFALPLLTNYVGSKVDRKNLVIVSPDSGRVRVAERWSELLGGCSIAFIHKTRDPRIPNEATVGKVVGDFVAPSSAVARELIIPGLPIKIGDNSKVEHFIRLMTPGKIDATASVEVISPEGVFIPVGFSNFSLKPEEVRDINLSGVDLGKKTFALKIVASEPIVASVFTEVKRGSLSDFMWSTPAQSFGTVSVNLYGLEPTFSFVSERIQIDITWRDNRGKSGVKTLIGQEIVNWKVPANTRLMTVTNRSGSVGAMSWVTADGVTHLPIALSTNLESATKPIADIAVIQPKK